MKRNVYTDALIRTLILILLSLFICGIAGLFCSCKTQLRYVESEKFVRQTDTIVRVQTIHSVDTISTKESVYINSYDSIAPILDSLKRVIGYDRYHFREVKNMTDSDKSRYLEVIDSLRNSHRDTVRIREPYPVEVVKTVAKPLSWWQYFLMGVGLATLTITAYSILKKFTFIK